MFWFSSGNYEDEQKLEHLPQLSAELVGKPLKK
jgi:hypothetical protein